LSVDNRWTIIRLLHKISISSRRNKQDFEMKYGLLPNENFNIRKKPWIKSHYFGSNTVNFSSAAALLRSTSKDEKATEMWCFDDFNCFAVAR
jgi:hypothetical protein